MNIQKIGIIGCGNVGATCAYTLIQSGMFSEIVLVDLNEARAKGEAMDLNHCLPFLSPMQIYSGNYSDLKDAAIIIISAGVNQKEGETRTDLLIRNKRIFNSIIENIVPVNNECIILVLTNPVDILTYITLKKSGFPRERVIGSGTVLDTARLKFLVGEKLEVDSRNVHTFIIGEHGDSELAVWSSANVSGIDIQDYCPICPNCEGLDILYKIYEDVKNSAYEIIKGKGATYYAIAQAALRIVTAIVKDENTIMPVSTLVNGHYGLDDVCLGIPAVVGRSGVKEVLDIPLNEDERSKLVYSAQTIKEFINKIKD